jgi:polyhydroxyalkanoate synthesis regulator phasin
MAAKKKDNLNVPEFLREPLESAQAHLAELEKQAQKLFKDLLKLGEESRKELAALVQRLSKQNWNVDELRDRVTKLRSQGMERAQELRERAESFRSDAMEKLERLQTNAVAFLGVATREQVEELSKELARLARRLDKAGKAAIPGKNAERSAAGV